MRTWMIRIGIAVVALVVLIGGGLFVYTTFFHSSDPELTTDDLDKIVAGTDSADDESTASSPAVTDPAPTDPATTEPSDSQTPDSQPTATEAPADGTIGFDGQWTPTDESIFGYRVEEVIAGVNTTATGRSNEIDGTLEIAGTEATIDISVLVENITSDESRRDAAFRGRIMEANEFPEATFVSTAPIDFGSIPADGDQITTSATGDLTLKGATQNVTFEVTAQASGERIGIFGTIPIRFEDYGIDNPSFGAIKTEDDGLLEFILVFEPA